MTAQLSYFGGSGGFFALWHILLGTDYRCSLGKRSWLNSYINIKGEDWPELPSVKDWPELPSVTDFPDSMVEELRLNPNWQEIVDNLVDSFNPLTNNSLTYQQHWNIKDRSRWKSTEIWPENDKTQKSDYKHKLFFVCNPSVRDVLSEADKKILLYTDYKTQYLLAKNKRAWKYGHGHDTATIRTTKFNGCKVHYEVAKIAEYTDYQVKLQDIVTSQGQALLDIFDVTINDSNIFHNNMWLDLHIDEERKRLLNES
jgi:hypothetical protein